MTSQFLIFIIIPIIGFVLLLLNFALAPHNPYKEKKTPFECGYHSWLMQNRNPFSITFFLFGLLFLVFDLEIVLIYPYTMSSSFNGLFGLWSIIIFTVILSLGFMFELGKKALKIDTLQEKNTIKYSMIFNFSLFIKKILLSLITLFGFTILTKYFFFNLGLYNYVHFINTISACLTFIIFRIYMKKNFSKKDIYFVAVYAFLASIFIRYLLTQINPHLTDINMGINIVTEQVAFLLMGAISAHYGEYAVMGHADNPIKLIANFMDNNGAGPSDRSGSSSPGGQDPRNLPAEGVQNEEAGRRYLLDARCQRTWREETHNSQIALQQSQQALLYWEAFLRTRPDANIPRVIHQQVQSIMNNQLNLARLLDQSQEITSDLRNRGYTNQRTGFIWFPDHHSQGQYRQLIVSHTNYLRRNRNDLLDISNQLNHFRMTYENSQRNNNN